jgi:hypothetical protein
LEEEDELLEDDEFNFGEVVYLNDLSSSSDTEEETSINRPKKRSKEKIIYM